MAKANHRLSNFKIKELQEKLMDYMDKFEKDKHKNLIEMLKNLTLIQLSFFTQSLQILNLAYKSLINDNPCFEIKSNLQEIGRGLYSTDLEFKKENLESKSCNLTKRDFKFNNLILKRSSSTSSLNNTYNSDVSDSTFKQTPGEQNKLKISSQTNLSSPVQQNSTFDDSYIINLKHITAATAIIKSSTLKKKAFKTKKLLNEGGDNRKNSLNHEQKEDQSICKTTSCKNILTETEI